MEAGPRFSMLPDAVHALLTGGLAAPPCGLPPRAARVLVLLLDAFGWRFVERYGDHPLLRRLDGAGTVTRVASQFPSTTTAHITTMHTGLPVGEHGLYEYHVLEPSYGRIVIPLRLTLADGGREPLTDAGYDVTAIAPPGRTLYERLAADGVVSTVHQPDRFAPSGYDRLVCRGSRFEPFAELEDGLRAAVAALAAAERGYAYVYFDLIDFEGHLNGPSSPQFDARVRHTLDAVEAVLFGPAAARAAPDTWLLLTADHGQIDVDPDTILWLDELYPPLSDLPLGPAGSARDVFLHVPGERVEETVGQLRGAIGDAGEVVPTRELLAAGAFGADPAPRLLERVGNVCVLPAPGRIAWLRSHKDYQCSFRGHHGGRTAQESETQLSVARLA